MADKRERRITLHAAIDELERCREALAPFNLPVSAAQRGRGYVTARVAIEDLDRVRAALGDEQDG